MSIPFDPERDSASGSDTSNSDSDMMSSWDDDSSSTFSFEQDMEDLTGGGDEPHSLPNEED
jgi:hypothetical protein